MKSSSFKTTALLIIYAAAAAALSSRTPGSKYTEKHPSRELHKMQDFHWNITLNAYVSPLIFIYAKNH